MNDFEPNTKVLAFHGPLIYEAKVVKVHHAGKEHVISAESKEEPLESNPKFDKSIFLNLDAYYLHYQGWNAKWDEWVTRDRVLAYNEENRSIKRDLEQMTKKKKKQQQVQAKKQESDSNAENTGPGSAASSNSSGVVTTATSTTGSKRKSESIAGTSVSMTTSKKRAGSKKPTISLDFPNELKYLLIDDWEFITKDKQLVSLPSKKPVSTILSDYQKFRSSSLSLEQKEILDEVISGLELYFNQSLNLVLLYKAENLQYMNFIKDGTVNGQSGLSAKHPVSEVYGLEHLLRLLISLPGLVGQTTMDQVSVSVLIDEVAVLLEYLTDNVSKYVNEYENMSPHYDSLSKI